MCLKYSDIAQKLILEVYSFFNILDPQVANYINGGHYNPHHDYMLKDKDPNAVSSKNLDSFQGNRLH